MKIFYLNDDFYYAQYYKYMFENLETKYKLIAKQLFNRNTILIFEFKLQFSGGLVRLYGCEQAIYTKAVRHQSNKSKSLTQLKKKSPVYA